MIAAVLVAGDGEENELAAGELGKSRRRAGVENDATAAAAAAVGAVPGAIDLPAAPDDKLLLLLLTPTGGFTLGDRFAPPAAAFLATIGVVVVAAAADEDDEAATVAEFTRGVDMLMGEEERSGEEESARVQLYSSMD